MHYIRMISIALEFSIRLFHRGIYTSVLESKHIDEATEMLASEFCKREPLCRVLGLSVNDIRGFFREQLVHVAKHKLGVVACNAQGRLLGVVTIEDYCDQFQCTPENLHPGIQSIGQYLDSIELPADIVPKGHGELYHCALAAVAKGKGQSQVLSLLFLKINTHLRSMGYKRGYAKVTNPGILKRFKRLEKYAFSQVFSPKKITEPKYFESDGHKPFGNYQGVTSLYSWPMY
ncbi:MAG: hypothetical protein EOP10_05325 [Proteobacteria bacterium]|nr:MAG: hypothetical protein EOP10_05325 [Pseudomonadota bacterium]